MPFSAQTLDFLFQNKMNNSRQWFHENKSDYETYVKKPLAEFAEKLAPYINKIDEQAGLMRISRVNRDTRFIKDGFLYRENMWGTFGRTRELYQSFPSFYFDISSNGFEYGCGYYCASADSMNAMRSLVLSDNSVYIAAEEAFSSQKIFEMYGDMYKRNHFPSETERKCMWLNRKTIGLTALCTDWQLIFSDKLADKVGRDMMKIAPVYDLFMKSEELAAGEEKNS